MTKVQSCLNHSGNTIFNDYRHDRPTIISASTSVFLPSPRSQVRFQYAFETVSGFILPYAVIIVSYVLILRRLRQTRFRRKVHSEKLILAIVVMFGLFWLPYHVVNMMQVGVLMPSLFHTMTNIQDKMNHNHEFICNLY